MAHSVLNYTEQKAIQRVECYVVAIIDRSLVLELAAPDHLHGASDRRIHPCRRSGTGSPTGGVACAAKVEAAEEVVDALVLDETDVVGQRAGLVGDTLDLVVTSQLNVDDDHDDDEEEDEEEEEEEQKQE